MRGTYTLKTRLVAMLVCIAMLAAYLPGTVLHAGAAAVDGRVTDPHTLDQWQKYFGVMDGSVNNVELTTEYAGGVWTDKSVLSAASLPGLLTAPNYNGKGISVADKGNNFIVALSAMASNKEVVGYSTIPTDTVMVLDLSSSMRSNDDNGGSAIDELVTATNAAIKELLELNKNNRVAVVLYAGNNAGSFSNNPGATTVILPLDSYTAAADGTYLKSVAVGRDADYGVQVTAGVKGSSGTLTGSMNTARGTFIQDGIYEAMKLLVNVQDTKVDNGIQAGTGRLPIVVLMTDGEPTLANRDYNGNAAGTDLGNSEIYLKFNNQDYNHRDTIAWLTQLTAAYAKREISQHYQTDALFYTLAFGDESTRLEEARSVMDPANTSATLNGFWNSFLSGQAVTVYTYTENRRTYTYTTSNDTAEPLTAADKLYVDKPFKANGITGNSGLYAVFEEIVEEIIVQSKYYPTYVEKDHDHDGYLTMVDKIGDGMEVTDIKGIIIGNRLFSGEAIAKALATGEFGSIANPNSMGDNLVWSVKERLGIADTAVAQTLLQNAYDHGQLAYNTQTGAFSNYIGWYSDAEGNYLDFWHAGMTQAQVPAGATHIIKSYGFLGDTTDVPGISNTDMMYMSVRISTEITTGKSIVTWQIPASLVPTVTYHADVEITDEGQITGLTGLTLSADSADSPIRLVYEVALQDGIYDWNVADKAQKDANGEYVFYTNKWNADAETTTENTYSHFEPSVENERYYYTQNTTVLVKDGENYAPYTGSKPSGGGYYRSYQSFEKLTDGTLRTHLHYEPISPQAMEEVVQNGSEWVIPKGVVHRYYDYEITDKANNATGTMAHSDHPFVVKEDTHYYTYSTQGNNGKLVLTPATGIKLTKTLAAGYTSQESFTFQVTGNISEAELVRLTAEGEEASRAALAADGKFTLQAGETVYVLGLSGDYNVAEVIPADADYTVSRIQIGTADYTGNNVDLTVTAQTITDVEFTNDTRGTGNLYIVKEIVSDHDLPDSVASQSFQVEVFVGAELAGQTFKVKHGAVEQNGTVDAQGYLKVAGNDLQIPRDAAYVILGLPTGTQAVVREILSSGQDAYFDAAIKTRDHTGAAQDNDGTVVIHKNANATAVLTNAYTPVPVEVTLDVNGTKNFIVESPLGAALEFRFAVQHWDGSDWQTISGKEASVFTTGGVSSFGIADVLEGITFDKVGAYAYQVVEVIPNTRANGVAYDRTLYTFTVTVTDVGGSLQAVVTDHDGAALSGSYDVSFTNTYHTAPVSVDVQKHVINASGNPNATAAGFTIIANETDSTFTTVSGSYSEVTDGAGNVRFAGFYDVAGDYYYTVRESIPAEAQLVTSGTHAGKYLYNGWYYDPAVYYLHISVTQLTGGDLVAAIAYGTDPQALTGAADNAQLAFTNIYEPVQAEVDLDLVPTVLKELEGRELENGEFTFYVTENNNRTNILLTGTNDAQGNVSFNGTLKFSAIGTYHFDIIEKQENKGGVTYDNTAFDMVVEVTDKGDGTLSAVYYFEDSVSGQVTFRNRYNSTGTEHVIAATKTLHGRPLLNGEFRFLLEEAVDAQGTRKQNGLVLFAENGPANNGQAAIQFPKITYNTPGTYYYKLTEIPGAQGNGISYSNESYVYMVKVRDNQQGALEIESSRIVRYNNSADNLPAQLNFLNTYKALGSSTGFDGTKELTGRVLGSGEFDFNITQTESDFVTPVANGYTATVSNDASGKIFFGTVAYEEAGTYYYLITEDASGALAGITYDTNRFQVTVKVTDNHNGRLECATTIEKVTVIDDEGTATNVVQPVTSIVFNNSYAAASVDYFPVVTKRYEGDTMKSFDFVLSGEGFQTQTKQNDNQGVVTFDKLTFTQAGTYSFTITEQQNALWGFIKWDTNVYTVNIAVIDEGVGQLRIDSVNVTSLQGRNDLVFRNVHEDIITEKEVALSAAPNVLIDGEKVESGDELIYTIYYTNYAGQPVDVTITDTIPQGTALVEGSAGDARYEAGKLIWVRQNVAVDETIFVSFKVKVTQSGVTVKNQAQVLEGSNLYTTNETVNEVVTDEVKKDVFLASDLNTSVDGQQVHVGDVLQYAITYHNADHAKANVVITDIIPANTTLVEGSAAGATYDAGKLTWNLELAGDEEKTVTFQVRVDAPDVFIDNQAVATDGNNTTQTNVVTNHTYEEVGGKDVALEGAPNINIDGQQVQVGQILTYTIGYTNITDAPVTVIITDTIPAYTQLHVAQTGTVDGNTITWTFTDVQPREKVTVSFQVEVVQPGGVIENQAQIFDGTNKLTNKVINAVPGKTVDKQEASVGEILTYNITYINTTGAPAKVVITDRLDQALQFVEGTAGQGVHADGTITWTFEDVPAGETVTVSFQAKVVAAGTIVNTAQIFENDVSVTFTNETDSQIKEADLSIRKEQLVGAGAATAEKLSVKAGEEVTYALTVANNGEGDAYDIVVTDKLPQGLVYVEGSANAGGILADGVITWQLGKLDAGDSVKLTFKVVVPQVKKDTRWTNVATMVYENEPTESNEVQIEEIVPIETPKTGDNFSFTLFISLMVISSFGLAAVVISKKQEETEASAE